MMYDADALYIGGHVQDPSPPINHYSFADDPGMAWDADAVRPLHLRSGHPIVGLAADRRQDAGRAAETRLSSNPVALDTRPETGLLHLLHTRLHRRQAEPARGPGGLLQGRRRQGLHV